MTSYNSRAAYKGLTSLAYYAMATGDDYRPKDDEQYIDCITDLLHAAESNGLDADMIVRLAYEHMQAERNDEELNREDGDE